ncbi:MAG: NADH-quinone oxidoreductase subunit A [Candidatus Omnitrophica bacterium]|nr:NADH-quinone oxidoreductase subunit A [Candidatus Omnitrophota bacterium]
MENYYGIFAMFLMAGGVSALFIFLSQSLGPKKPNPAKDMPYECGIKPFELPSGKHAVKFYLAGMLFVLFDVEMIFFFPWAVVYRKLGWFGFVEMMVFLGVLVLGFLYAWKKGALEWK